MKLQTITDMVTGGTVSINEEKKLRNCSSIRGINRKSALVFPVREKEEIKVLTFRMHFLGDSKIFEFILGGENIKNIKVWNSKLAILEVSNLDVNISEKNRSLVTKEWEKRGYKSSSAFCPYIEYFFHTGEKLSIKYFTADRKTQTIDSIDFAVNPSAPNERELPTGYLLIKYCKELAGAPIFVNGSEFVGIIIEDGGDDDLDLTTYVKFYEFSKIIYES